MSFILDALQRADAERTRGTVPGLHARPVSNPIAAANPGSRKRMGLAVVGSLALALAATIGWMWQNNPQPAVVTAASMPPVQTPAVAPTAASVQPLKPAPMAPSTSPQRQFSAVKAPASPAKEVVAAAPPTAPLLSELPEEIRRQIPPLGISGAVYSDNPAQRLLLVNGQVLGQGSLAAPDVTLVEIRSSSSEFSFRGTRFRLTH